MTLHPTTARFLTALAGQIDGTLRWWAANHPDKPLDPGVATGLCPRRCPVSRSGKWLTHVDEALWERGRARYGAPR